MRVSYRGCEKVRVSGVASAKGCVLALDHGRELHELLAREAPRLRVVVPPHDPLFEVFIIYYLLGFSLFIMF